MSKRKRRERTTGTRNPVRNATFYGLLTLAGIAMVVTGIVQMRHTGRSSSPWLALGMFPTLLGPFFFVYYLHMVRVFRAMREGRGVIASWNVPASEFARFCEREQAIPARSILVNYYKPPAVAPAEGVEVVFSDRGVLIDGGYFPLSVHGGRQVQSVEHVPGDPPAIQFGMSLHTLARTSRATIEGQHRLLLLRVPVALSARDQAGEVEYRYRALMSQA